MNQKITLVINRVGLILLGVGLIALGILKYFDNNYPLTEGAVASPIIIIIGMLILVVVVIRWKNVEDIGK